MKEKRYFNTSGPNIPAQHYTLKREPLIKRGRELVKGGRYFTIWAPRQTGKSTYFGLLAETLKTEGYDVMHTNLENFKSATEKSFLEILGNEFHRYLGVDIRVDSFALLYDRLKSITERRIVLIFDEVEGLNEELFGQFLHTIRNLYHFRESHSINSIILVGVSNIVGIVQDNASPFNIADNLAVPYFSNEETRELLGMHEKETGQLFAPEVKAKISGITANQPGLVNGFANHLVTRYPSKPLLDYPDYLKIEDWYLTEAIDKNISNVINKAKQHRKFVEMLLFTEEKQLFKINDDKIKFLHTHGLLRKDKDGYVEFWVPMYKKAVYDAFYPYSNGERGRFFLHVDVMKFFDNEHRLNFDLIIGNYREYVKRRSFKYFREKDKKTGQYKSIKEAALAYSFETYIQALIQTFDGKSYLEPHVGLGRSDLIINIENHEYVIEFKIFRDSLRFEKGKKQIAAYCRSVNVKEGVYLVFVPNTVTFPSVRDIKETINGVKVSTYIVFYDEEKEF
ncbi:MAG: hypothetical protein GY757_54580 [bacterium]|nr:hypothetical protein [bacterium]